MAVRVIDLLEVIDIEVEQGQQRALIARAFDRILETLVKSRAIQQAGQAVDAREADQAAFLALLRADILHHRVHADHADAVLGELRSRFDASIMRRFSRAERLLQAITSAGERRSVIDIDRKSASLKPYESIAT